MMPKLTCSHFGLFLLLLLLLLSHSLRTESKCNVGCDLALASYYVWADVNLTFIAEVLQSKYVEPSDPGFTEILSYNPNVSSKDFIETGSRINVPFPCDCLGGEFLGHTFRYTVRPDDTYDRVADTFYENLTTPEWLQRFNIYPPDRIPDENAYMNVTVNCSCGNGKVSKDYGLFVTYPLSPTESLESVAAQTGLDVGLLQRFNRGVNFSKGSGIVYIPGKDKNGSYPTLKSSKGIEGGVVAGISVAIVAGLLVLGGCAYMSFYHKKFLKREKLLLDSQESSAKAGSESTAPAGGTLTSISVDKSIEFSYDELSSATNNFSMANKIGEGGFGVVYYAELRGEKAAIKKMEMKASKEFLAELKVHLIGYCTENSLFLVYEYIENGNLSQHLRGSGRDPLPWPARVQIALDSAIGLEYIHEHTNPAYVHRDIKPANILIDKNFHGKVADFGLAKLAKAGSTRLVGTFGYMPPEVMSGSVSPKVDVYAFGVVLYELISAKEAIVNMGDFRTEVKTLVALFEDVVNQPDPGEELHKLVDPRLGDFCPFDSVYKVAQLAKACTQAESELRPSMRSVVVSLMALSSH